MGESKMERKQITNKNNEVLTTKDGKELYEFRFEVGDEFIPVFNNVLERTNDVDYTDEKGKQVRKKITNYSLKCKVRDKNGSKVMNDDGSEEVFVTLTPAQAESMKRRVTGYTDRNGIVHEPIELNQHMFTAYSYESENYGEQIGLGLKKEFKPAKDFSDFN